MRHRIMYFIAFIAAGAFAYFFHGNAKIEAIVEIISTVSLYLGLFITLIFAGSTTIGAAASLRRTKQYGKTIFASIFWVLVAVALPMFLMFFLGKLNLLGIKSISADAQNATSVYSNLLKDLSDLSPNLTKFSTGNLIYILSIIVISFTMLSLIASLFVGYHLKPETKVLRPAYLFFASYTELCYRVARALCNLYMIFILFMSTNFFFRLFKDKIFLEQTKSLIIALAIVTAVFVIVIYPVMFLLFSKFKKNPFPAMWTAFVNGLTALFSNTVFAYTPLNVNHRFECYLPKKTTSVSSTIMLIFSRAGSAIISYFVVLFLTRDISIPLSVSISIPIVCAIVSLFSGIATGLEPLIIILAISTLHDSFDMSIIVAASGLIPLLNKFSSFLDTYVLCLGSNAVSGKINRPSNNKANKALA